MNRSVALVVLVGCASGGEMGGGSADAGRSYDASGGGSVADAPENRADAGEPRFDGGQPLADAGARPDAGATDGACAGQWVELLLNGDFDDGPEPWTQYSELGTDVLVGEDELPITPDSPHCAAWLGGYNGALDQLYQGVTVPPGATALRIRGKQCFATEEPGGSAYDFLTVALLDPDDTVLEYLTWSNLDAAATCSFTDFEIASVGSHAGESIQLYFEAVTDGEFGITNFFLDTLAFEAFVPGC